jgi:hypothetical protein
MRITFMFPRDRFVASSLIFLTVCGLGGAIANGFARRGCAESVADFVFAGVNYFHRYTQADQHEYTPKGQEDLDAWKDMVTINFYRTAKDGEGLASVANAVLQNYKANRGMVIKTDSVPRTKDRPAEHLIVTLFPLPEFVEVAFARFKLHEGTGAGVIYSHRIYGKAAGKEMSAWLQKNGPDIERELMRWDSMPKAAGSK